MWMGKKRNATHETCFWILSTSFFRATSERLQKCAFSNLGQSEWAVVQLIVWSLSYIGAH